MARYDGTKNVDQFYLRHKDAFKIDRNNLVCGQKLRKITIIVYLNDFDADLPVIKGGELRVYLADKIVDVVPRMGRVVIFNSERVEHEVRPTLGYDRYAITVWAHQIVPSFNEK